MTLAEMQAVSSKQSGSLATSDESADHFLSQILHRVRRAVFEPGERESDAEDEDDEPDESSKQVKKLERKSNGIELACTELDLKLGQAVNARLTDDKLSALLAMWLELGVMLRRRVAAGAQSSIDFSRSWLHRTARSITFSRSSEILRDHILVVAAVLSAKAISWFGEGSPKFRFYLSILHLDLRHLNGGVTLDSTEVLKQLASAESWIGTHLAPDVPVADLPIAMNHTLQQQDIPSEVMGVLCGTFEIDTPLLIWETVAGKALRHSIAAGSKPPYKFCSPKSTICPQCHLRLTLAACSELKRDGITWCPNCSRLLVEKF
jgi:hypothetical protein